MEKYNKLITVFLISAVLLLLVAVVYLFTVKEKIVFVDSVRLFEEFKMKKDYQKKIDEKKTSYQKYLDSTKLDLKVRYESMARRNVKDGSKEAIEYFKSEQLYFMKEKEYQEEIETISSEYTSQIWKRLNQYLKEYGNKQSYDFILGAKGDGNLMHANPSVDETDKVIQYVNNQYEGNTK